MNKDNDISNDDVSEYNNYNLNKCLEEYYDDDNIVHNKINSIEMDIFDEMNGSNLSMKSVLKKKKKWEKMGFDIFNFGVYCCFGLFSFKDIILV